MTYSKIHEMKTLSISVSDMEGGRKKKKVKQVFTLKFLPFPKGLRIETLSLKMLISCFITCGNFFSIKIKSNDNGV